MTLEGSGRRDALARATVFLVATAVTWWALSPYLVGVFHDDGIYALLARSIATGRGFYYSHLPGTPAAVHYPPLYPILLAALWRVWPGFPSNVMPLLGANAVMVGIAALGWMAFATRCLGWRTWSAVAGALLCTLMLPTLALASALLSETLFLAALWPVLLLSEDAARSDSLHRAAWTGIALGLLVLVRTHALALVLAVVLMALVNKQRRTSIVVLAAAALIQVPWILWTTLATPRVPGPLEGSYGSYLGWFARGLRDGGVVFVVATVATNVRESWLHLGDRLGAGLPAVLQALALVAAMGALVSGVSRFRSRAPVTALFLALYAAIMVLWPYTPWRFIWGVWPVVMLLGVEGGRTAIVSATPRVRPLLAALALVVVAALLLNDVQGYAHREWRAPARSAAQEMEPVLPWIHANVPPGDAVLSEGEQVIALYEGRMAAPPVSFTALEYVMRRTVADGGTELEAMLRAEPARWVILMDRGLVIAADSLHGAHPGLQRVDHVNDAVMYRVTQ